jgi:hypothetical protein
MIVSSYNRRNLQKEMSMNSPIIRSGKHRLALSILVALGLGVVILGLSLLSDYADWRATNAVHQHWVKSGLRETCATLVQPFQKRIEACVDQKSLERDPTGKQGQRDKESFHIRIEGDDEEVCTNSEFKSVSRTAPIFDKGCVYKIGANYEIFKPDEPMLFSEYVDRWSQFKYFIERTTKICIAAFTVIFLMLSAFAAYLAESNLGWRRSAVVIGSLASIATAILIPLLSRNQNGILIVALCVGLAMFPTTIFLLLTGRRVFAWVSDGFHSQQNGCKRRQIPILN